MTLDTSGGWASLPVSRKAGLSYVHEAGTDGMASTAVADVWWPPSPMALPDGLCDDLVRYARERCEEITHLHEHRAAPSTRPHVRAYVLGVYREPGTERRMPLAELVQANAPASLADPIIDRLKAANASWWTFDVDTYTLIVKRYEAGGIHHAHADWMPDANSQARKLSSSIQLSDPGDYEGGSLLIRRSNGPDFTAYPVPRDRGTMAAFPSWTMHEVTPVGSGERWVLLANAWGPRLR